MLLNGSRRKNRGSGALFLRHHRFSVVLLQRLSVLPKVASVANRYHDCNNPDSVGLLQHGLNRSWTRFGALVPLIAPIARTRAPMPLAARQRQGAGNTGKKAIRPGARAAPPFGQWDTLYTEHDITIASKRIGRYAGFEMNSPSPRAARGQNVGAALLVSNCSYIVFAAIPPAVRTRQARPNSRLAIGADSGKAIQTNGPALG